MSQDPSKDFLDLMKDIEAEAVIEGPSAVAELDAFDEQFHLAAQLMQARSDAHLSQKALAEQSGVQQAEISKIERGEVIPRMSTMNRLLRPLGRRLAIVPAE